MTMASAEESDAIAVASKYAQPAVVTVPVHTSAAATSGRENPIAMASVTRTAEASRLPASTMSHEAAIASTETICQAVKARAAALGSSGASGAPDALFSSHAASGSDLSEAANTTLAALEGGVGSWAGASSWACPQCRLIARSSW